jgi:diadenosine tetraphosphate (Ap4A) HIT family hydrolase
MDKKFFNPTSYNRILFESENFVVIPSLGSLVSGWLLIVPKRFSLNLSLLKKSELEELDNLATNCERTIKEKYGTNVVRFEHGPSIAKSKVGCGVDYAHLHLVPINFDLIIGLQQLLHIDYYWTEINSLVSLSDINFGANYLYYRNIANQHFITVQENIPSQLFRRVIASYLHAPETFDWKLFPQIDKIEDTINNLSQVELV